MVSVLSSAASGVSLVLVTVSLKIVETLASPSSAVSLISIEPMSASSGVPLKVRVEPLKLNHEGSGESSDCVAE